MNGTDFSHIYSHIQCNLTPFSLQNLAALAIDYKCINTKTQKHCLQRLSKMNPEYQLSACADFSVFAVDERPYLKIKVGEKVIFMLIDTGAQVNIITEEDYEIIKNEVGVSPLHSNLRAKIAAANGSIIQDLGVVEVNLNFKGRARASLPCI